MEFKEYQVKVLERLDQYLAVLKDKKQEAEDFVEFQRSKGKDVKLANFCSSTWDELNEQRLLPTFRDKKGQVHIAPHVNRQDGLDRPVPNICLKVPTAGGKTLLATAAIERINTDYFHQQTGMVLWVVPSDSIYKQTWKNLANREHPYRQVLERASGGRVKLLEKTDNFTRQDVEEYLCVMLLMLQSSARKSKETLRMFRDSGKFSSFFPDVDDYHANNELLNEVRNLKVNDLGDEEGALPGVSVRHSLGNALRLTQPIIVIDEGHKAYSETARETMCSFNPRLILELSATPNHGSLHSNILVDVSGTALKEEQMIKVPINVFNFDKADWKYTLSQSHEELAKLQKYSQKLVKRDGRYIRPIMIIRVDRTGKDQRDGNHIHAKDARDYLIDQLGVKPEMIRIKSASVDELGDEDLLSNFSEVRYIITKDALREGWDCPFAYILTILSKTTASMAMTQMIGRVLRQPEAQETSVQELNECYIFCFDQEVQQAVESVRKGLAEEGMSDLGQDIKSRTDGDTVQIKQIKANRKPQFKGLKILLPRVLHKDSKGKYRPLDYHRDILANFDWGAFSYTRKDKFTPDEHDKLEKTLMRITMATEDGQFSLPYSADTDTIDSDPELDFPFMVRQIMDVVPNPWQATRIIEETLSTLEKRGIPLERFYANRLFLLKEIRRDLQGQIHKTSETLFRDKLNSGEITFQLMSSGNPKLNWELAEAIEFSVKDDDRIFQKKNGESLDRFLFEKVYEKDFNDLEKDAALYLDGNESVKWWHRLVVRQDYNLQGWQKNKIYPDFLACLNKLPDGKCRFTVLETKGEHLKGNDDTEYKRKLFDLLMSFYNSSLEAGEMEIVNGQDQKMIFKILLEDSWRTDLASIAK
jgi:type III restriction enzyme